MKQSTQEKLTYLGFYLVQYLVIGLLIFYFQPFGRANLFTQKVLIVTLACIGHFPISGISHCLADIVSNWFKPVVDPASPDADKSTRYYTPPADKKD